MTEYMPTTENILNCYIYSSEGYDGSLQIPERQSRAEFDRWLNEIRAEAWAEGFDRGFYRGQILHGDYDACEAGIKNPYRPDEK